MKQLIEEKGGHAELLPFDVADPKAIEAAIDSWEAAHPDEFISVLVNNAGIRRDNVMFMMSEDDWHKRFGYEYEWFLLYHTSTVETHDATSTWRTNYQYGLTVRTERYARTGQL